MTKKFIFKLTTIALTASASLSAFGQYNPSQYNPNIQQNFQPNQGSGFQDWQSGASGAISGAAAAAAANTAATYQNPSAQFLQSSAPANVFSQSGYSNDGTLFMGGQRIGNPHQILHDLNVPSFFGVNANRLSYSDSTYGQGTLAQMENHTLTIGVPVGNVVLSRLYLTPTNPYTQGVTTPYDNYKNYSDAVQAAQAGSYQLTVANDNKLYAFKTLGTISTQSQNILIKELPAHSVFIANSDPKGGAVAVRVTQNGDYAAIQNYIATTKPYDFSWRSALAPMANDPNTGAFVANWVMGSHQVQAYQLGMQNQSMQTGNEAFGVLAWDANQNKYVMLDSTNMQATAGSVSGNMPTLGNNQFGFFGMHTHPGSATPSNQDNLMTQQLGLDQMVIGTNGTTAIMTNNPSNNWQGAGFDFEGYNDGKSSADKRTTVTIVGGGEATYGLGGKVSSGAYVTFNGYGQITESGTITTAGLTAGLQAKGAATVAGITEGPVGTLEGWGWNLGATWLVGTASFGGPLGEITTIETGAAAGYGASVGLSWTISKPFSEISKSATDAARSFYNFFTGTNSSSDSSNSGDSSKSEGTQSSSSP
jgi:hypothetical protein